MKKFINVFLLAVILPAFIFTGCKDDTDPVPVAKGNFETLKTYMVANDLDLPTLLITWVIAPTMIADGGIVDVDYTIPGYYVFDIRGTEAFNGGHIKGAMDVPLADVLIKAEEVGKDKPILVVCSSGQTAGRAVMALRLSGFSDAKVMKFGMSYWNAEFDAWTANVADAAVGSPGWNSDASASLPVNDFPTWETTSTDGAEILENAVTAMLANGEWKTVSGDVLAAPGNYNIYNFWDEAAYTTFGHFDGAYQILPISLADDVVAGFPTSDQFEVYCYTGQTSSMTVAWLQVLGYNARSILYGANTMVHTALEDAGKPAWHSSYDYEYETSK